MTEKNSSYRRTRSRSSLFISSQFPMALHSTIEWKEQQRSIVWTSFLKKRHLFGDGPLNRGSRSSGATSNRKRVEERFVMKWCRSKFHPSSPRERERERELSMERNGSVRQDEREFHWETVAASTRSLLYNEAKQELVWCSELFIVFVRYEFVRRPEIQLE